MIYEFSCTVCGHTIDRDYKYEDRPTHVLTECENCDTVSEFEYQLSAPPTQFKGIGWFGKSKKD